jgi:hypothetical protein
MNEAMRRKTPRYPEDARQTVAYALYKTARLHRTISLAVRRKSLKAHDQEFLEARDRSWKRRRGSAVPRTELRQRVAGQTPIPTEAEDSEVRDMVIGSILPRTRCQNRFATT